MLRTFLLLSTLTTLTSAQDSQVVSSLSNRQLSSGDNNESSIKRILKSNNGDEDERMNMKYITAKLRQSGTGLFDDSEFINKWAVYSKNKVEVMLGTLTKHYSISVLLEMLNKANAAKTTKDVATRLQSSLMNKLLANDVLPGKVFTMLNLHLEGDEILFCMKLPTFIKYMARFQKKHPHERTTLITIMLYFYGVNGVDEILSTTKHMKSAEAKRSTISAEKRFVQAQLELLLANGVSPEDFFMLLEPKHQFLTSPRFTMFNKYVEQFNNANIDKIVRMAEIMDSYYGSRALSTIIFNAKKVLETEKVATHMMEKLVQYWLDTKKLPVDVLKAFGLDQSSHLFSSPGIENFVSYVYDFKLKWNGSGDLTPVTVMAPFFTCLQLAEMIIKADKNPFNNRMEQAIISYMVTRRSSDDIFLHLHLDRSAKILFDSPVFKFWLKFLKEFKHSYGLMIERTVLINTYEEDDLVEMILKAKQDPETRGLAEEVEEEIIDEYIFNDWDAKELLEKLYSDKATFDTALHSYEKSETKYITFRKQTEFPIPKSALRYSRN